MSKTIRGGSVADMFGDAADGWEDELSRDLLNLPEEMRDALLLHAYERNLPDCHIVCALRYLESALSDAISEAQAEGLSSKKIVESMMADIPAFLELGNADTAYLPSVKDEKANFKTYRIVGRIQAYFDEFEDASIGSFGPGPECGMNA